MDMERKGLRFDLKDGDSREFTAVFATFDVVDLDGDVTRPGAFKDGAEVIVGAYGHNMSGLPVGKGVIRADQREARVDGAFFDTDPATATYQTLKSLGPLGEWSYVFTIKKQAFGDHEGRRVRFLEDMEVWSVDPVLKGAGINTRTVAIKSHPLAELPFVEHVAEVATLAKGLAARAEERAAVRAKEGRNLSVASVEELEALAGSLKASAAALGQLVADDAPKGAPEFVAEMLRFERIRAELLGVS